jgi:TRAP-type mannitol/chloroaromatic compound transport system substrate-binding protein
MKRINFIKGIGAAAIATTITSCTGDKKMAESDLEKRNKKYSWKLVSTWPPNFPVLGTGLLRFSQQVEQMSLGQMTIKVYGGGELVPALEVFDAVSSGGVEIGHGASYYWSGKVPAAQFFTTMPFGMNAQQMNAWLYAGGGIKLWQDLYAKYGLVPFPGGNTGVQMGGWFNKKIEKIEDFKGLKIRMAGIGGKILEKLGSTVVLSPAGELYTNLERGVIDALEWIGPYHDYVMGFQDIAKYYYAPGWHETGSTLEFVFNKKAFEELPDHLKTILSTAAAQMNLESLCEFEAQNNTYLQKVISEGKSEVLRFPKEVLDVLRYESEQTLEKLAEGNEDAKNIYTSYRNFFNSIRQWGEYSEKLYHQII